MFSRTPRQNPVLATKRDGYLADGKDYRDNLLETYKESISRTIHLHASLLFTTSNGRFILKGICSHVTNVNPSIINTSWRDLAAKLGYSDIEVKCTSNLQGSIYDPTEIVLRIYAARNANGTVGSVLQALLDLGLLPALHNAQEYIDKLLAEVENGTTQVIEIPSDSDAEKKKLLKSANFKFSVPAIFDSPSCKDVEAATFPYNRALVVESCQRSAPVPAPQTTTQRETERYCKYVWISFAEDGYKTAQKIAAVLRSTKNKKGLSFAVVLMCEKDEFEVNPAKYIQELLPQMDCVIPVLTEGYFEALRQPNHQARLLDERYVQFIHDKMLSKYIHNGCRNFHVRAIVPSQMINNIKSKNEFNSTIFTSWRPEDELNELAKRLMKSSKKRFGAFR